MKVEQDPSLLKTSKENNQPDTSATDQKSEVEKAKINDDESESRPVKATNDLANNDGSVVETLDTALHGKPGWSEENSIAGSNRADYYEARSYGKADDKEELEAKD